MPLVWCLNRAGRSCGIVFMALRSCGSSRRGAASLTHYLLGGSQNAARNCGTTEQLNPVANIGAFHGKCHLNGASTATDPALVAELLAADFICWLGTKQQAWVRQHKYLLRRGVILTVGFAFDERQNETRRTVLVATLWTTWVCQTVSQPRRLGPRYLKYNFLFLGPA
jgi:UDP-N-acetyl-D-mannosaminuronic acid transferase (WecB/TagA/CpsF family)